VFRSKALLAIIAAPLLAFVIACGGGDDDSSSGSSGGSGSGDNSSSSSGASGDDRSGGSGGSGDSISLENCKQYESFATTAAAAFSASGPSGQFKLDKGALDKMVKATPKEIRGDMEVVVGALVAFYEVLEKAGLTDPSKLDPAKLQAAQADLEKAAAKLEDPKIEAAGERIEAFFEKNCS
jgi:hypothetical protein